LNNQGPIRYSLKEISWVSRKWMKSQTVDNYQNMLLKLRVSSKEAKAKKEESDHGMIGLD
jgi:hypothetical protein